MSLVGRKLEAIHKTSKDWIASPQAARNDGKRINHILKRK
jgi:hypothetical protein